MHPFPTAYNLVCFGLCPSLCKLPCKSNCLGQNVQLTVAPFQYLLAYIWAPSCTVSGVLGYTYVPGPSNNNNKITIIIIIELQKMWKMRVVILPLVLGTLGSVPFCLENNLKTF